MLSSPFRIVFFGVLCVAFRIGFYSVFADSLDVLHMPAWTSICTSAPCRGKEGGGRGGGEGGLMTSVRMRILSCVSLVDLVLVCSGAVH